MVEARVDQGGAYALAGATPETRVDQGGVYALVKTGTLVRADQGGMYALVAITAQVPVVQAGLYMLGARVPCGTRWAQLWTIRRVDGAVHRFTSLDIDLEYPAASGIIYRACSSLVPSASEQVAELGTEGTMDLSGMVGEGGISELALYAGLFDGAYVEAWLTPWSGSGVPKRLLRGNFGPVEHDSNGFKVELIGDGAKLAQTPLIRLLKPGCWKQFGDRFCQKDLGPLTVAGAVDVNGDQRSFVHAARGEAAGYFTRGRVTFTTGLNAGISAEIKEHAAGGVFTLWPKLAFPINGGDAYEMTPGCTNIKESSGGCNGCTAWDNEVNFGGFDKVPGKDKRGNSATVRSVGGGAGSGSSS